MATSKYKSNRSKSRPKPLSATTAVGKARFALARAQNIEHGHPSKKHTAARQMAEERVLIAINAHKKRKRGKKV